MFESVEDHHINMADGSGSQGMSYQAMQLMKDFQGGEDLTALIFTQSRRVSIERLVESLEIRGWETKGSD